MLIAFLIASLFFGMFISYIWSSKGFANVAIKMVFSAYTLWTAALLIGVASTMVNTTAMKLF